MFTSFKNTLRLNSIKFLVSLAFTVIFFGLFFRYHSFSTLIWDEPNWIYRGALFSDAMYFRDFSSVDEELIGPNDEVIYPQGLVTRFAIGLSLYVHRLYNSAYIGNTAYSSSDLLLTLHPWAKIGVTILNILLLAVTLIPVRRLFNRRVVLMFFAFCFANPVLSFYSTVAHVDVTQSYLLLLSILFFLLGLKTSFKVDTPEIVSLPTLYIILSGLFTSLAIWQKTPSIVLLPFIFIYFLYACFFHLKAVLATEAGLQSDPIECAKLYARTIKTFVKSSNFRHLLFLGVTFLVSLCLFFILLNPSASTQLTATLNGIYSGTSHSASFVGLSILYRFIGYFMIMFVFLPSFLIVLLVWGLKKLLSYRIRTNAIFSSPTSAGVSTAHFLHDIEPTPNVQCTHGCAYLIRDFLPEILVLVSLGFAYMLVISLGVVWTFRYLIPVYLISLLLVSVFAEYLLSKSQLFILAVFYIAYLIFSAITFYPHYGLAKNIFGIYPSSSNAILSFSNGSGMDAVAEFFNDASFNEPTIVYTDVPSAITALHNTNQNVFYLSPIEASYTFPNASYVATLKDRDSCRDLVADYVVFYPIVPVDAEYYNTDYVYASKFLNMHLVRIYPATSEILNVARERCMHSM